MPSGLSVEARRFASLNPATGEVLCEFDCRPQQKKFKLPSPALTVRNLRGGISAFGAAAKSWRRFQQLLHERKGEVARLVTEESGKPYAESLGCRLMVVLDAARFLLRNRQGLLQPQPCHMETSSMKAKAGVLLREPHGVIGIISPWNYPFSTPASETLAALVTGNAVVLNPRNLRLSLG